MTDMPEDPDQYEAATRVILGLLQLQTKNPGAISATDLPGMIRMAADNRVEHGDFGAARLLDEWAEKVMKPAAEWED